jgi:hypothetical protein
MRDGKIRGLPISEITIEEGDLELVRPERMKPYLALLKVQVGGQDPEPHLKSIAACRLKRYVWRAVPALKWAFCDLDAESVVADLRTLSEADAKKVMEPLTMRFIHFCLFLATLVGEEAADRIMQQTLRCAKRCAKESSAPPSGA